jgi:hypothetical protein
MNNDRFELKPLTDEQLVKEYYEVLKEKDELCDSLSDSTTPRELISEIQNSDLPYCNDKIDAIEMELRLRNITFENFSTMNESEEQARRGR